MGNKIRIVYDFDLDNELDIAKIEEIKLRRKNRAAKLKKKETDRAIIPAASITVPRQYR